MSNRFALILAGGSGERFWPLSQPDRPKQFLCLAGQKQSLLERATHRVGTVFNSDRIALITSAELAKIILDTNHDGPDAVIIEPKPKNTFAAILWAIAELLAQKQITSDSVVVAFPSDHEISPDSQFQVAINQVISTVEQTRQIVIIGVPPSRPESGYGYIEIRREQPSGHGFAVVRFHEKPDSKTAKRYLNSGDFFWNSGITAFQVDHFLKEAKLCLPEAEPVVTRLIDAAVAQDYPGMFAAFEALPSVSVDVAVLEKSPEVACVPAPFKWDDLGAWDSLERIQPLDEKGNVIDGNCTVLDSSGCIVFNDQPIPVGVLGLEDVVVVATKAGFLVCRKQDAQKVREIAKRIAPKAGLNVAEVAAALPDL